MFRTEIVSIHDIGVLTFSSVYHPVLEHRRTQYITTQITFSDQHSGFIFVGSRINIYSFHY